MGYGQCSRCGATENIGWDSVRDRPKRLCRPCAAKVQQISRDKQRRDINRRNLLRKWGVTAERYAELEAMAGYRCQLCDEPPAIKPLCVDHRHSDGAIRGLLCNRCNIGLGFFKDDPVLLARAAAYVVRPPVQ